MTDALNCLYDNDISLIEYAPFDTGKCESNTGYHVGERAIVFRFAHYLANCIEDDSYWSCYKLDCEYNRNKDDAKRLASFPNGTFPDIILHKRGSNEANALVIEVKTYWNKKVQNDIDKLKEFTRKNGEYKYEIGILLVIGKKRCEVSMKEYVDGCDTEKD